MANDPKQGLAKGLTNYGDPAFSLYLRRSFAKSMGYSGELLAGPVGGTPRAGRMMPPSYAGGRLGACTDCRRFWALHRAGKVTAPEIGSIEGNLATAAGTCAGMGTASTMA